MLFIDIKKEKPIATEIGDWDGKRCTNILVATMSGQFDVATVYCDIINGKEYYTFYDKYDHEIHNVAYWCYIDNV